MVQQRTRTSTLLSTLMYCSALMVLPSTSGAQNSAPATGGSGAPVSAAAGTETIEVDAPRLFSFEPQRTNGSLKKASLAGRVSYADLDLRTDEGVVQLRSRIAQEAADICAQLAQVYPVYAATGTSCVKDAIQDGTIRANRVITTAREPTY